MYAVNGNICCAWIFTYTLYRYLTTDVIVINNQPLILCKCLRCTILRTKNSDGPYRWHHLAAAFKSKQFFLFSFQFPLALHELARHSQILIC